jgi:hypothetical protein
MDTTDALQLASKQVAGRLLDMEPSEAKRVYAGIGRGESRVQTVEHYLVLLLNDNTLAVVDLDEFQGSE